MQQRLGGSPISKSSGPTPCRTTGVLPVVLALLLAAAATIVGPDAARIPMRLSDATLGQGYWLIAADGGLFNFGTAGYHGSEAGQTLSGPIVGGSASADGGGYYEGGSDGAIYAFGDAPFLGSTYSISGGSGAIQNWSGGASVVGMSSPPGHAGYWLVTSNAMVCNFGGLSVYAYGYGWVSTGPWCDWQFAGGSNGTVKNIVGIQSTEDSLGYWLVGADGSVYAFGDAQYLGGMGGQQLNQPIVGMSVAADGRGYWLVGADGGIFAFGTATYDGGLAFTNANALPKPIVGIAATAHGKGYWLTGTDGSVFPFGDGGHDGSETNQTLNKPVVAIVAAGGPQYAGQIAGALTSTTQGGNVSVYWRGYDGQLYEAANAGAYGWIGPFDLGGSLASDPSATTAGSTVEVFWEGTDGNLWWDYLTPVGEIWSGPQSLGDGTLGGPPAALGQSSGVTDVFWQGTGDNGVWHIANVGYWTSPADMGGNPVSAPYPITTGGGNLHVFFKGSDSNLWNLWYTSGVGWSGPASLGDGPLGGSPVAIGQTNGVIDVFWQGTNLALWHAWYVGAWYGPASFGGSVATTPATTISGTNTLQVYWGATNSTLWSIYYTGTWNGPLQVENGPLGGSPDIVGYPSGALDLFWPGDDRGLWHAWWTGSSWAGPILQVPL